MLIVCAAIDAHIDAFDLMKLSTVFPCSHALVSLDLNLTLHHKILFWDGIEIS